MHSKKSAESASQHAHSANVNSGGLVKATLGAAAVAAAILTFIWLPAEYGIDPTGVGHTLGLTEMGEIKEQLHAEANADAAMNANASTNAGISNQLNDIQSQLAVITAKLDATSAPADAPSAKPATTTAPPISTSATSSVATAATVNIGPTLKNAAARTQAWKDNYSHKLEPGEGIEVKLKMIEGAVADFEWSANGAVLNYDTHGDGNGKKISYEKGRGVPEQSGKIIAAFTGNHGWFWRNRTDDDVELTLLTRGDYSELVLPK